MDLRPRFTDLFALVGILTLLVSAPAYVAQDEAGEDLSDGWEGTLPAPRDGAYMEIEMVATWKGREPVVVGPVWTHEVRAARPGEVPVEAVFVYERQRLPLHIDLGWGTYTAEHYLQRLYFDAAGAWVWETEHMAVPSDDDPGKQVMEERERRVLGESSRLNEWRDVPLHYFPSFARLMFENAARNIVVEATNSLFDQDAPNHQSVTRASLHRGIPIFAAGGSSGGPCSGCHSDPIESYGLTFKEGVTPEKWLKTDGFDWIHRDWPLPIGPHMWYYDTNTTEVFLETDFVPRVLDPGDGPRYHVEWRPRGSFAHGFALPRTEPVAMGTMRLGDLASDTRPLHREVSARDLQAALDEAGLPGRLTEFYWVDDPPQMRHLGTAPDLPLPITPQAQQTAILVYPTTWYVTTATPDGALDVVELATETSMDGTSVVEVRSLCEDEATAERWALNVIRCRPVAAATVEGGRTVGDPLAAIEEAARQAGVTAEDLPAFGFLTLFHQEVRSRGHGIVSVEEHWGLYPTDARLPYSHWGTPDRLVQGVGTWRTNQTDGHTTGSFDLSDGGPYSETVFRDLRPDEAAPAAPQRAAVESDVLHPLAVVGTTAVAGGLFLVGASLLLRFIGWLKAGGSVPLLAALYAKIARSEVLTNERRSEIMDMVAADPGVTASDVARNMGYGWGATVHHLETLVKNGFLIAIAANGKRHYFTTDGTRASRQELAARRDPQVAAFLDAVAAFPGRTLKEIAKLVDRRPSGLSRTGSRLEKAGLVRKERDGMSVRFWPVATDAMNVVPSGPGPAETLA